jgi:hypothetical protein
VSTTGGRGELLVGFVRHRHDLRGGGGPALDDVARTRIVGAGCHDPNVTAPVARSFGVSALLPLGLPVWGLWALLLATASLALWSHWRFRRAGCPRSGGWRNGP